MVLLQALVAAGAGVTIMPGVAVRSHSAPRVIATEIPESTRRVLCRDLRRASRSAGYGRLLTALHEAALHPGFD
jgi:DNA-binding transcriptional LysR family regulator